MHQARIFLFLLGEAPTEFVEVFCDDSVTDLPAIGDWVPVTVTALIHPAHFWVNFPCGVKMFCGERSKHIQHYIF